jgi:cytosine/uracil/thiamine/allantoin permease
MAAKKARIRRNNEKETPRNGSEEGPNASKQRCEKRRDEKEETQTLTPTQAKTRTWKWKDRTQGYLCRSGGRETKP